VPPDETTFTIHGTIKGSAALKEYFKKRSTQKRATPNNPKNDNKAAEDAIQARISYLESKIEDANKEIVMLKGTKTQRS
jgi:uracil-DNA glycosylase